MPPHADVLQWEHLRAWLCDFLQRYEAWESWQQWSARPIGYALDLTEPGWRTN